MGETVHVCGQELYGKLLNLNLNCKPKTALKKMKALKKRLKNGLKNPNSLHHYLMQINPR